MMKHRVAALALAALLAAACAPVTQRPQVDERAVAEEARKQRELALADLLEDSARLFRVSFPILVRGAPLCGDKVRPSLGARFASLGDFGKDYREAAAKLLGLGDEVSVVQVVEGSPAQRAGLRERDVIVALQGKPAPRGKDAARELVEQIAEAAKSANRVELRVRRAGAEQTLAVEPEPACDYPVVLHPADAINAFADGRQVAVMRGMLRFVRDDLELAVVVGHELAHNSMKHIEKQTGNVLLGTILDILAAAGGVNTQGAFGNLAGLVFSKEFEAEADYVGLYFTARAGYDVARAPNFWRRMAAAAPGAIGRQGFAATHPSTPERFVALEKTVAEIRAKQAAGRDLAPEIRP
ncbi:MAG: M48 family metallopeptidase [Pseudomonadota bacterium]